MTVSELSQFWAWSGSAAASVRARYIAFGLLGLSLSVLAAAKLDVVLTGLSAPFELDYGESVVYGQAARLLHGEALYHHLDQVPYSVTAYMPVYYAMGAVLQAYLGPGFLWGRVLSLVSGLAIAYAIGHLAAQSAGSKRAGWIAALMFGALGSVSGVPWYGLYRVDTLGIALSLASIVVLYGGTSRRRLVLAGLLAGLGLLTKQTLVAAPLAGGIWLVCLDRRKALLFGASCGLLVGVVCAALQLTTGAFVENAVTANINPTSQAGLSSLTELLMSSQLLPVLCATLYLAYAHPWQSQRQRLLILYWLASAIPIFGIAKYGAGANYWLEFAAVTAVLASLGLWVALDSTTHATSRVASTFMLVFFALYAALAAPSGTVGSALMNVDELTTARQWVDVPFSDLVARVKAEPRGVLALPLDVVVLANKPVVLETLIYSLRLSAHEWDPQPLIDRICTGQIGLVVLGVDLTDLRSQESQGVEFWPAPVMAALQSTMAFDSQQAGRFVYVPRATPVSSASCPLAHGA